MAFEHTHARLRARCCRGLLRSGNNKRRARVSRASTDAASLRWRATGGGRSSGAARGRNNETRSHTHRRARRIQMPLLLCGGKSHQRATLITRGARDARASPAAIHAGVAGAERQAARCRLPS